MLSVLFTSTTEFPMYKAADHLNFFLKLSSCFINRNIQKIYFLVKKVTSNKTLQLRANVGK